MYSEQFGSITGGIDFGVSAPSRASAHESRQCDYTPQVIANRVPSKHAAQGVELMSRRHVYGIAVNTQGDVSTR